MKINENTRITGDKIVLIPYRKHHVPKYHEWMSSQEIQELTASEPLSIEEEYEMQAKWQNDPDKLTFIILRKDLFDENIDSKQQSEREVNSMIGDVNCFIIDDDDEEDENHQIENDSKDGQSQKHQAELEVMIVDTKNRGNGYGIEAVYLMINYCVQYLADSLNIKKFIVKIGETNTSSIKMFAKLGFVHFKDIKPFQQVCFKLDLNAQLFEKNNDSKTDNKYKFKKDFKLNIDDYLCN